jgi:hypothetical protein
MKFLRLGLCAAAFVSLSATAAHAQTFGLVGGGNWEALADIDASLSSSFQTSSGIHVGAFMEIGTPIVSVRPSLLYSNAGSLLAGLGTLSVESFRVSNLIVPVDIKLNAIPVLYLFGGPEFQVNLSNGAPAPLDETFNKTNLRAGFGLGLDFGRVYLESRYVFGISSLTKTEIDDGTGTMIPIDKQTSGAIRASIGVALF